MSSEIALPVLYLGCELVMLFSYAQIGGPLTSKPTPMNCSGLQESVGADIDALLRLLTYTNSRIANSDQFAMHMSRRTTSYSFLCQELAINSRAGLAL